jgi:tetratricopeptide (TPR) repeat protein
MRAAIRMTLALVAAQAASASPMWTRVSSPSIILYTDSSERTARMVLKRFETLHRIFHDAYTVDSPVPLRVFLFSSEREFEQYRATPSGDDFYMSDGDGEVIVLDESVSLRRTATHEYLHMVMHHASALLPAWLSEGLAEFYSTVSVTATKVRVGDSIESDLVMLKQERWLSAGDLALGSPTDGKIFYAESWALVHMLSLSPQWKNGMPEFVKLLAQGSEQEEAFTAAFGKSMNDAVAALRLYVQQPRDTTIPAPPAEAPEEYEVTRLPQLDATLALAGLAMYTSHPDLGRSLYLKASKENPHSPAAVAGLGTLALSENRKADAQRQFEQAIAMGYRDAGACFELATLTHDNALLDQALAIDPKFAQAHFLLGVRATDSGNLAAAIEHLRQATALEPRRFTYWHALGYAQSKSGDRQGAAASARRATLLASTAPEEQIAFALTQLASEPTPAVSPRKPDVTTPPSWQNRKGDTRAEGTLTWVNCDSSPVRLLLSAPASIELYVLDPGEVELVNAEGASATLACGEQSQPVAVEYVAATKGITKIAFKHVIIKR